MTITELIKKHSSNKKSLFRQFAIELLEMVKENQSEIFTKQDAAIEARIVRGLQSSIDKALEELKKGMP